MSEESYVEIMEGKPSGRGLLVAGGAGGILYRAFHTEEAGRETRTVRQKGEE